LELNEDHFARADRLKASMVFGRPTYFGRMP